MQLWEIKQKKEPKTPKNEGCGLCQRSPACYRIRHIAFYAPAEPFAFGHFLSLNERVLIPDH